MRLRTTKHIFVHKEEGGEKHLLFVPAGMTGEVYELQSVSGKKRVSVAWDKVFQCGKDEEGAFLNGSYCGVETDLSVDDVDPADLHYFAEDNQP